MNRNPRNIKLLPQDRECLENSHNSDGHRLPIYSASLANFMFTVA